MRPVWMRLRRELRHSVLSWITLALVVGIAAGSVIALAAAARRTDSSYRRFVAGHAAASLIVAESTDFVGTGRLDLDAVAGLPQVAASARVSAIFIGSGRTEDGLWLRAGERVPMAPLEPDRLGTTVNRWRLLDGRRADQSRVDEVVLSFEAARANDLSVGDTFRVQFVPQSSFLRTDVAAVRAELRRAMDAVPVLAPIPPTDVTSFGGASALPVAIAAVMLLVTATILSHALVTSLRRRRHDFAVLEVLGFVRRQRSLAVSARATTFALLALAIGIPIGWIVGRWGWDAIARELGVPSEPRAAGGVLVLVAVGRLVVANVVAVVPAWPARRAHAADALRTG